VELFVNGKSQGVQGYWFPRSGMERGYPKYPARNVPPRTTGDLHLTWTVPYQPGTLKAVGTKDGKVVATQEISTTGEPAAVNLSVDRGSLLSDRRDVAHVTVRIVDSEGRMIPAADHEVSLQIQGEGRMIGLDSGEPASHADFKGNRTKVFNGMCLAMVQSTAKPGRIQVTATSPGLKPASVTITTSETRRA
jgi:beta-galactosidase